ncbi:T9SS type A sorting domain-containing protein [Chryseobacterium sp.]|uniref:T9SS type A sorting domain-containing protein n=1 Tax=Chryseobacterium sp. TaxID=1871047 RepID=UPI0012AAA455|nr:T9SS type A sorting domain-containing protein [Chryseobacterium sp.]QFG53814.1 T9SS type A sorting domain-containing protein [Chryseobacterium sp.]
MKKQLYLLLLGSLATLASAQTYSWQWAKYGGGNTGSPSLGFNYTQDESIRDIAVDNQNNYYYLATMNPTNPTLNGTAVNNYDRQDLFLFSTDCQGNVRWTRNIGGTTAVQQSWNIELDNNGGLYIMGTFQNRAYASSPTYVPLHFDTTNHIPVIQIAQTDTATPDPGLKTAYLLKYSTANGNLEWQKPLQGNVTSALRSSDCGIFYMDSSKNIHAIVGFAAGTHLNGAITVPASFTGSYQYYLIKFSYNNGNMTPDPNPLLLPITGFIVQGYSEGKVSLLYDGTAGVNQYYLAGKRMQYGNFTYSDFSYGGTPFTEDGYLLAFNGTTGAEVWRKEINTQQAQPYDQIFGMVKDANSDIYITGSYFVFNPINTVNATFGNYTFPSSNGLTPFVMKLQPNGNVLWSKTVDGYANTVVDDGYNYSKGPLVLNGNEVAFVKGSQGDQWGTYTMNRPANDDADPLLVRLNKETGAVIGAHEILSSYGSKDEFTSVAVDNDGNYILGGFMHGILFEDPNDGIPSMNGLTGSGKSQFFVSKLAKSACSAMATAETPVQQTDVAFYPNPVQDVLNIKTKEKLLSYEVITADGRLITQGKFARTYTVDMTGMTTGVYYVKVQGEGFATTGKVIKK